MGIMNSITFSCIAVPTPNIGRVEVDSEGYRKQILGALNVYNSVGELYSGDNDVLRLFEANSVLMNRISRGKLRCELGHPQQQPGMSNMAYAQRLMKIDEGNTIAHIRKITLEFNKMKDSVGRPVILIVGEVAPSGIHAQVLEHQYENTSENVCFSLRGFTDDKFVGGKCIRSIKNIITWDYVNDNGIWTAEKFNAQALESKIFSRNDLEQAFDSKTKPAALESVQMNLPQLFDSFGWDKEALPCFKW